MSFYCEYATVGSISIASMQHATVGSISIASMHDMIVLELR